MTTMVFLIKFVPSGLVSRLNKNPSRTKAGFDPIWKENSRPGYFRLVVNIFLSLDTRSESVGVTVSLSPFRVGVLAAVCPGVTFSLFSKTGSFDARLTSNILTFLSAPLARFEGLPERFTNSECWEYAGVIWSFLPPTVLVFWLSKTWWSSKFSFGFGFGSVSTLYNFLYSSLMLRTSKLECLYLDEPSLERYSNQRVGSRISILKTTYKILKKKLIITNFPGQKSFGSMELRSLDTYAGK